MNKIIYSLLGYIISLHATFADGGLLGDFAKDRPDDGDLENRETTDAIRDGDIHMEDIPNMMRSAIDFFITISGTIAIIFIIIGGYKILLGSLEQDKTKGKDTIIMALGGFIIATLAWFIVNLIIDNFS